MQCSSVTIDRLEAIRQLPTLPVVMQKLLEAVNDNKSGADRIARIIDDDPAIVSRLLRIVNSIAFNAGGSRIKGTQQAIARLGLGQVTNIALSTAVLDAFNCPDQAQRRAFWEHSIYTGIALEMVAQHCAASLQGSYEKEELHILGLLHDIGKLVLSQFFPRETAIIQSLAQREHLPISDAEARVLGLDHAQVGEWLTEKWQLSDKIREVIRWHHCPLHANTACRELACLCHVANTISNSDDLSTYADDMSFVHHRQAWHRLNLRLVDLPAIITAIKREARLSEVLASL